MITPTRQSRLSSINKSFINRFNNKSNKHIQKEIRKYEYEQQNHKYNLLLNEFATLLINKKRKEINVFKRQNFFREINGKLYSDAEVVYNCITKTSKKNEYIKYTICDDYSLEPIYWTYHGRDKFIADFCAIIY